MAGRSKFQEQQRQELFAKYNYACGRCGSMLSLEEDHIIPRKQQKHFSWDLNTRKNMQCLCHDCNNWKNGHLTALSLGLDFILPNISKGIFKEQ